jgi:uncharacterized membrane protein YeiH
VSTLAPPELAPFWGGWLPAMGIAWRVFDLIASGIWAISGAILAARQGFDVTGIFTIALVSATGGGLLRDGLFLQAGPPALVRTPAYVILAGAAALLVWAFGNRFEGRFAQVVMIADALGLGAFAVVGMKLALAAGLSLPAVALVGVVNAVGGGILRSVFLRQIPEVFRPGELTALAALSGCVLYLAMTRALAVDDGLAAACSVATVAIVRIVSVRYRVMTSPARGYRREDP